jgi:hypothetical protein
MIYLRYRMRLARHARENMKDFWAWLEKREEWFYRDLPMVKEVRWYYTVVGDVYTRSASTAKRSARSRPTKAGSPSASRKRTGGSSSTPSSSPISR